MMRRIIITSAALLSFAPWVFSQVTCDSFDYGNTAFWIGHAPVQRHAEGDGS